MLIFVRLNQDFCGCQATHFFDFFLLVLAQADATMTARPDCGLNPDLDSGFRQIRELDSKFCPIRDFVHLGFCSIRDLSVRSFVQFGI